MQQPRRQAASTPSQPQPAWQPRIFDPGGPDDTAQPGEKFTLRRHYEEFFLRHYKVKPETAKEDRSILKKWELFTPAADRWPDVEQDPDVRQISSELLEDFFTWCGTLVAHNTVCKYRSHLSRITYSLGPGNRRNKKGAALVDEAPWIQPPQRQRKPVTKALPWTELSQILSQGRAQPLSNLGGLDATVYQRSLHWFVHNTALRIDTVMRLRRPMIVALDGRKWLDIPAELMKGGKHPHLLYLNRHALAAMAMLPGDTDVLYPFASWPKTQSRLEAHQTAYWASAGIVHKGWGYHAERVTTLSWCQEHYPVAAKLIAAHHGDVTLDFYTLTRLMIPALDHLPQPACEELPWPRDPADYRPLFD